MTINLKRIVLRKCLSQGNKGRAQASGNLK